MTYTYMNPGDKRDTPAPLQQDDSQGVEQELTETIVFPPFAMLFPIKVMSVDEIRAMFMEPYEPSGN